MSGLSGVKMHQILFFFVPTLCLHGLKNAQLMRFVPATCKKYACVTNWYIKEKPKAICFRLK